MKYALKIAAPDGVHYDVDSRFSRIKALYQEQTGKSLEKSQVEADKLKEFGHLVDIVDDHGRKISLIVVPKGITPMELTKIDEATDHREMGTELTSDEEAVLHKYHL
ncbi:hypothetical protein [Ralstonia phage RP13]|nr:hypothetical protein [Ralstonia phage RP13]